jgi:hypothetical protein
MLSDLSDDTIAKWTKAMMTTTKSFNTVRERMGRVLAVWNWAAKRGIVTKFPTITRPPGPDPVPFALDEE